MLTSVCKNRTPSNLIYHPITHGEPIISQKTMSLRVLRRHAACSPCVLLRRFNRFLRNRYVSSTDVIISADVVLKFHATKII